MTFVSHGTFWRIESHVHRIWCLWYIFLLDRTRSTFNLLFCILRVIWRWQISFVLFALINCLSIRQSQYTSIFVIFCYLLFVSMRECGIFRSFPWDLGDSLGSFRILRNSLTFFAILSDSLGSSRILWIILKFLGVFWVFWDSVVFFWISWIKEFSPGSNIFSLYILETVISVWLWEEIS